MKKIAILFLLLTFTSLANAQDFYVGATVSRSISTSENMQVRDIFLGYPGINIHIGNNFSRYFGARISAGFNPQQGRSGSAQEDAFPEVFGIYRFFTISAYADAMLNLTELFLERDYYRTDALYLTLGGGAIRTSNFSSKVKDEMWEKYYPVDTKSRFFPVVRVGLAGSLMLTKSLDLDLEAKYNFISDEYNGVKHGSKIDGYVDINVGINWFFSRRHLQRTEIPALPVEIMSDAQTERRAIGQRMKNGVSFYFGFSNLASKQNTYINEVAQFLSYNKDVNVVIHGYADKDYTDAAYIAKNEQLARERAQAVYDRLVNVEGISPDRLSISAHNTALAGYKQSGEWIRAVEFEMTK